MTLRSILFFLVSVYLYRFSCSKTQIYVLHPQRSLNEDLICLHRLVNNRLTYWNPNKNPPPQNGVDSPTQKRSPSSQTFPSQVFFVRRSLLYPKQGFGIEVYLLSQTPTRFDPVKKTGALLKTTTTRTFGLNYKRYQILGPSFHCTRRLTVIQLSSEVH